MRALALFDVHGNADALQAVLRDPGAAGADVVVVGGDAVPGPFAREVLELLDGIVGEVRWIKGNGEREVSAALRDERPGGLTDMAWLTAQRSAEELDRQRVESLATAELTLELDGVLYCHASPRADDEMLTRISHQARYHDALDGIGASTVIAGHTHQQDDRFVDGVRWLNAGSVGLPYEGTPEARWAWVQDGVPELRSTGYDAPAAGRRMLKAGWPDEPSIRAALIDPVPADQITALFEAAASG